jgi:hypothetical protein
MLVFEDWLIGGGSCHTSLKCYLAATPMNRDAIEGPKKKEILEHTGLGQSLRAVG